MKVPKILPWLARKAGVPEARAETLWTEAIVCATLRTGWVGTSEYWKAAVERLVELIELEAQAPRQLAIEREPVARLGRSHPCERAGLDQKIAA